MGEAFFVQRNVDNKHRVIKKAAVETKRLNMPEPKMRVTDYEEVDAVTPEGPGSPPQGATSPRQDQSRTNSKEQVRR